MWYWNPAYSFSRGLRPLNNGHDVLQLSKDVVGDDVIYVYVGHIVGIPEIVDDSELDVNIDVVDDDDEDDVQCTSFKVQMVLLKMVLMILMMLLKMLLMILMLLLKM